jgi:hypothetical protein
MIGDEGIDLSMKMGLILGGDSLTRSKGSGEGLEEVGDGTGRFYEGIGSIVFSGDASSSMSRDPSAKHVDGMCYNYHTECRNTTFEGYGP